MDNVGLTVLPRNILSATNKLLLYNFTLNTPYLSMTFSEHLESLKNISVGHFYMFLYYC